ncbi:MAG: tandem-95 repeat protein, partial [Myxococcaceae bacterium]|nr:tandem-95 repeat protein [Myxococcaceae bacterium]
TGDSFSTPEDTALQLTTAQLLSNDTDAQTPNGLSVTAVMNALHGTVVLSGSSITFTPEAEFNGLGSFEYTVSDGQLTDVGGVAVTITPVDDPPVATPQMVSTDRNTPVAIILSGTDIDTPKMNLLYAVDAGPAHGAVTGTPPNVLYTPTTGYSGADSFTFTVSDSTSTSPTATVSLTVTPVQLCGDGIVDAPEPCDDGNKVDTDGCTNQCKVGPLCDATALGGADRFVTDPATGTCYASYDDDQTTFAAAQTACIAAGGTLATITSASEQAFVSLVQNPAQNPWIGAQDDANTTDTVFTWVTKEPWSYTHFATGQPDDDVGTGGNGDCLHLMNPAGEWNDTNCTFAGFVTGRICELPQNVCGDGIVQSARGETCDDGNAVGNDGCSATCQVETLRFSEYVEGSSNNKALEIYNPFLTATNLTGCSLRLYSNGATSPTNTVALTQTIASHDVFVACNSLSNASILAACDLQVSAGALGFNGDDVVELFCNGAAVDVIGQIGNRGSGGGWGSGTVKTFDATLRRKCSVFRGDSNGTNAFDPALEWDGFATDLATDLGTYSCP